VNDNFKSETAIRVGISSCLLGEAVRFDGNHKFDNYINRTLAPFFELIPFCPEVAIGMGVPRPPIRLEGGSDAPRAVGVRDRDLDVTDRLRAYSREQADSDRVRQLSGFLLKSKSPSCGMERVKVYHGAGASRNGRGLFAAELMAAQPHLPVEEEGRLGDPVLRENFIQRLFAYHRWQQLSHDQPLTPARLVAFHSHHKLVLMAHGPSHYQALGRLVATAGSQPLADLAARYIEGFMSALQQHATRALHSNVLQHLLGYLKRDLDSDDKAELLQLIDRYRLGELPLIVPLTLLRHHFRRHPNDYVAQQVYLHPHPPELMLLNQI